MNNGNKNKFTLIIISIVVFLLLVFSATYAIISSTYTYDNKNVNATIGLRPIFTAGPSNTIAMNIPYVAGTRNSVYEISNESSPLNVTLQTNYEEKTTCTYDIIWEWDETSDATKQYIKTSGATKEFTVSGSTTGASFTDVQLNDYSSQDRTTLLYSGSISVKGNNVIKTQEWTITTRFYKTTQDQAAHRDHQYTGKIIVENVVCARDDSPDVVTDINTQIIAKSNQTSSQTSGGTWAIVNEGDGLRYEGKDPDNYICFSSSCTDNELYRIIGKFTEMVDTTGNGTADTNKEVIKIIKNTSIGQYAWNSAYSNNWSSSSLKTYLNDTWTKPTNNILVTRFSLKGSPGSGDDTATTYNNERNGSVYSGNSEYWDGKVALMYASDYGYGVLSSNCSRSTALTDYGSYGTSSCYTNDWLYHSSESSYNQATLTHIRRCNGDILSIYSDGEVYFSYGNSGLCGDNTVTQSFLIRPSFYLDASSTGYTSGTGSKADPYIYSTYVPTTNTLDTTIIAKSNQTSSQSGGGTYAIVNEGNGIRYEGKDPDNYVCFKSSCTDDELYRIIGKFMEMVDTNNDGTADTNQNVIKIIKNTSIGKYYWNNSTNTNNWADSTVRNTLNNDWTKPTDKILNTRFWTRGHTTADITAEAVLNYERNGSKSSSSFSDYADEKIGLIYPSDYGFAVLSTECSRSTNLSSYSGSCLNNWLFLGKIEGLITPWTSSVSGIFGISSYGSVGGGNGGVYYIQNEVRPAFYIDANTEFASGNGSKSNPYKIISTISFTLHGNTYQAEEGMTWNEWINSNYSSGADIIIYNNNVYRSAGSCSGNVVFNANGYVSQTASNTLIDSGSYSYENIEYSFGKSC